MGYRDDRDYYERKSLEDSMKYCFWCLIGTVALFVTCGLYQLLKWLSGNIMIPFVE